MESYVVCAACGFAAPMEFLMWHQRVCPELEPEKREFRESALRLKYGVNFDRAVEVVQKLGEEFR